MKNLKVCIYLRPDQKDSLAMKANMNITVANTSFIFLQGAGMFEKGRWWKRTVKEVLSFLPYKCNSKCKYMLTHIHTVIYMFKHSLLVLNMYEVIFNTRYKKISGDLWYCLNWT